MVRFYLLVLLIQYHRTIPLTCIYFVRKMCKMHIAFWFSRPNVMFKTKYIESIVTEEVSKSLIYWQLTFETLTKRFETEHNIKTQSTLLNNWTRDNYNDWFYSKIMCEFKKEIIIFRENLTPALSNGRLDKPNDLKPIRQISPCVNVSHSPFFCFTENSGTIFFLWCKNTWIWTMTGKVKQNILRETE